MPTSQATILKTSTSFVQDDIFGYTVSYDGIVLLISINRKVKDVYLRIPKLSHQLNSILISKLKSLRMILHVKNYLQKILVVHPTCDELYPNCTLPSTDFSNNECAWCQHKNGTDITYRSYRQDDEGHCDGSNDVSFNFKCPPVIKNVR